MQITVMVDTANDGPREGKFLLAVAALLGSTAPAAIAAPTPTPEPVHPLATSDALIEQEARRAAGELTGDSNGGEGSPPVDSSGLPWDARIHSLSSDGSKPTNANGTWRRKRGADDATVAAVEAELRGAAPTGVPADTVVPPPPGPATPTDVPPPPVEQPNETPPPPPVDTVPATSAATSAGDTPRFAGFADITKALNEIPGTVYNKLNAHAAEFGLSKWIDARNQPEIWDEFYDTYKAANGA